MLLPSKFTLFAHFFILFLTINPTLACDVSLAALVSTSNKTHMNVQSTASIHTPSFLNSPCFFITFFYLSVLLTYFSLLFVFSPFLLSFFIYFMFFIFLFCSLYFSLSHEQRIFSAMFVSQYWSPCILLCIEHRKKRNRKWSTNQKGNADDIGWHNWTDDGVRDMCLCLLTCVCERRPRISAAQGVCVHMLCTGQSEGSTHIAEKTHTRENHKLMREQYWRSLFITTPLHKHQWSGSGATLLTSTAMLRY